MSIKDDILSACASVGTVTNSKQESVEPDDMTTFCAMMKIKKIESILDKVFDVLESHESSITELNK